MSIVRDSAAYRRIPIGTEEGQKELSPRLKFFRGRRRPRERREAPRMREELGVPVLRRGVLSP